MNKLFSYLLALCLLPTNLYAEGAAPQGNPMANLFPLIIIFGIFYFLLIRPQQKKAKEHQSMLNALKKDDKIITSGGIYGVVNAVKGESIEVKIAEGVKVQVLKSAISTVVTSEAQAVTPEVIKQ